MVSAQRRPTTQSGCRSECAQFHEGYPMPHAGQPANTRRAGVRDLLAAV